MNQSMCYKNAPIIEAIIDFRVSIPSELTLNDLKKVCDNISDIYKPAEPLNTTTLEFAIDTSNQTNNTNSVESQQIGFILKSYDDKHILQIRRDGFTASRIAPYKSWDNLIEATKQPLNKFLSLKHIPTISRIAVRYINRIDIPSFNNNIDEYLRTAPKISEDLIEKPSSFFMQIVVPIKSINGNAVINQTIVNPVIMDTTAFMLDIDVFMDTALSANDPKIWNILEQLRIEKNRIFESSITEKTRELFKNATI